MTAFKNGASPRIGAYAAPFFGGTRWIASTTLGITASVPSSSINAPSVALMIDSPASARFCASAFRTKIGSSAGRLAAEGIRLVENGVVVGGVNGGLAIGPGVRAEIGPPKIAEPRTHRLIRPAEIGHASGE